MHPTIRERSLLVPILLLSTVPLACGLVVGGTEGAFVVLPCSYNVRSPSDIATMCWGRGSCPNSKCNDALIWTDGHKVTYRSDPRYQLNTVINRGQVSLIISNARMEDAGIYCCRVEHAGWFNDKKLNIELKMKKAITTTLPPSTTTKSIRPVRTTTIPPPPPPRTTFLPTTPVRTTTPQPLPVSTSTPPTKTTTLPAKTTPLPTSPARSTTLPTSPSLTTSSLIMQNSDINTVADMNFVTSEFTNDITSHDSKARGPTNDYHSDKGPSQESLPEPDSTSLQQLTSNISINELSDYSKDDQTTEEKKERSITVHIVIIAVSVLLVLIVAVPLLIVKYKGKMRGQYLFGFDPNLELVSHAEPPLSEDLGVDRADADDSEAKKAEWELIQPKTDSYDN